jgi:alpha-L-fucosidase
MFIHWGPSTLSPGELSKVRDALGLDDAAYARYVDHFEPDLFDPDEWARLAVRAGMTYVVVVTKHHDGFCMWDSRETDFTSVRTAAGRDFVREITDAFRARGLRVGFYYSLIDWHHPQFPLDGYHPMRDDPDHLAANAERDMSEYAAYMRRQLEELLGGDYGEIDLLWLDFSYADWDLIVKEGRSPAWAHAAKGREAWESEELFALARRLQPQILVNDRADVPGDFVTREQFQPAQAPVESAGGTPWEACLTLNETWSYRHDDHDWKSAEQIVRFLVDTVAKGGNLLLNVGPTGRGHFDPHSVGLLDELAGWMRLHGRAIHGAGTSAFPAPAEGRYTQRGNRLYLHLYQWPLHQVHLPGLAGKVEYVQFLHDATELRTRVVGGGLAAQPTEERGLPEDTLTIELPARRPDVVVPVVEIFLAP